MPPTPEKPRPILLADHEEDENYASEEDSDFAPDDEGGGAGEEESGDSDDEAAEAKVGKKRKLHPIPADEEAGFENSGDEAVIQKGKKKRKKRRKEKGKDEGRGDGDGDGGMDGEEDEDQEEYDGPLIKTRSMKAVAKAERKHKTTSGPVTVDVNALWESMISAPILPTSSKQPPPLPSEPSNAPDKENAAAGKVGEGKDEEDMVTIKRTYNFAGKVHTETKTVLRDSAEARLYLASQSQEGGDPETSSSAAAAAPCKIRRAFRSAFEPLSSLSLTAGGGGGRKDLNLGLANLLRLREEQAKMEAKKLNTVQKSKLDWAVHVDEEGIREELEMAGRKKGNFGDTQEFLARVEGRKDDEARRVRLAGKA